MSEEPIVIQITATCHTVDCGNEGLPIPVWVVEGPDPYVVCGVCELQITDLGALQ